MNESSSIAERLTDDEASKLLRGIAGLTDDGGILRGRYMKEFRIHIDHGWYSLVDLRSIVSILERVEP